MRILAGNIVAIYQRELQSYFASPLAYVVAGVFWLLAGVILVSILILPGSFVQRVLEQDVQGAIPPDLDVAYEFLRGYLESLGSLSMFILPTLSMGLYAEERKRGTLELLATSPITNWAVALGKLLGVVTVYVAMILPLMICEAIALGAADPPMTSPLLWVGNAGLVLMAASILALGMFVSSLTESTVLSAIMAFGLLLLLGIIDLIGASIQGPVGEAITHLSLLRTYQDFTQGIFDTGGLALFLSYIFLGLFLTAQSIETFRFQRS